MGIVVSSLGSQGEAKNYPRTMTKIIAQVCLAGALFPATALAGWKQIQETLLAVVNVTGDRAMKDSIPEATLSLIEAYGCYCYFDLANLGNNINKGRGEPVNFLDSACKTLMEGYKCAMIDAKIDAPNEECVPWEAPYWPGYPAPSGFTIWSACQRQNADNKCNQYACAVEGRFIDFIINDYWVHEHTIDGSKAHENGFDVATECVIQTGVKDATRSCCGTYPFRYTFKPQMGNRECCGDSLYDPGMQQCCNDQLMAVCPP